MTDYSKQTLTHRSTTIARRAVKQKSGAARGFVALMSAILISAILLILIFTLNISSFFNRFNVLDAEDKRISLGLAEACVNKALLKISQGDFSGVPGTFTVDASDPKKVCKICEMTAGGSVKTRAVYNGTYSNLVVAVDPNSSPMAITSWSEVGTYSGATCTFP